MTPLGVPWCHVVIKNKDCIPQHDPCQQTQHAIHLFKKQIPQGIENLQHKTVWFSLVQNSRCGETADTAQSMSSFRTWPLTSKHWQSGKHWWARQWWLGAATKTGVPRLSSCPRLLPEYMGASVTARQMTGTALLLVLDLGSLPQLISAIHKLTQQTNVVLEIKRPLWGFLLWHFK